MVQIADDRLAGTTLILVLAFMGKLNIVDGQ
jgi:hypothetical protein